MNLQTPTISYFVQTTAGWQIFCQWRDGSTSWQDLSLLKESHPIEMAEFAVLQGISGELAFNWWVPHTLRKREAIIKLAWSRSTRYLKKTHKFGIELPQSVTHALEVDQRNGNTLWANAIAKEMKDVWSAFRILDPGDADPVIVP